MRLLEGEERFYRKAERRARWVIRLPTFSVNDLTAQVTDIRGGAATVALPARFHAGWRSLAEKLENVPVGSATLFVVNKTFLTRNACENESLARNARIGYHVSDYELFPGIRYDQP